MQLYAVAAVGLAFFVLVTFFIPSRWAIALPRTIIIALGLAYGVWMSDFTVSAVYGMLVVVDCARFLLLRGLFAEIKKSAMPTEGDGAKTVSLEWLTPFMRRKRLSRGDTMFRVGDRADEMYLITKGEVRLTEIDIVLRDGAMIGEIGLFSASRERTATAMCDTDVEIFVDVGGESVRTVLAESGLRLPHDAADHQPDERARRQAYGGAARLRNSSGAGKAT